jgi:hypothetical protein
MRRLPLAAVLLFVAVASHAQTLGPVDWIFLVDTSKSMRGVGGAKDIWADVKVSLNAFVREAGDQDTITLYAFDRDVREIVTPSRDDLYRAILLLDAQGNRTHLGAAIAQGLGRAETLRHDHPDATRRQVVVLLTDGTEDVRGIRNPVPIEANVDRAGDTFVFFVSMGDHEPQLDAFAARAKHATVLKAPTAEKIRNVSREIRTKIAPKPEPPPRREPPPTRHVPPPIPKPPPSLLARVLAPVMILAVVALAAFLLHQQQRKKNRLEGELEILSPRAAPEAAFIGLPALQANEVRLSAILPGTALSGSDARLFARRRAGRKKVWIAAQGGSLRVNDVETPMSELYDADTIEIGDAKLRFNHAGNERPFDSYEEADL